MNWLIDWFQDWLIDWLIDSLIHWLAGWLAGWLIDLFIACFTAATSAENADTSFIEDAVHELLNARRVLRASYPYGYYLTGHKDKKAIFESMQVSYYSCVSELWLHIGGDQQMAWSKVPCPRAWHIYISGWRETMWSKVSCLRTQHNDCSNRIIWKFLK